MFRCWLDKEEPYSRHRMRFLRNHKIQGTGVMTKLKLFHLKNEMLTALLFACNLIPLFSILQIIDRISGNVDDPATDLQLTRSAIFTNGLIFIGGFGKSGLSRISTQDITGTDSSNRYRRHLGISKFRGKNVRQRKILPRCQCPCPKYCLGNSAGSYR